MVEMKVMWKEGREKLSDNLKGGPKVKMLV